MSVRVEVKPELLQWACERARMDVAFLSGRFPRLGAWVEGEVRPTLKQLERFAKATHTPVGFLFLPEPPVERIPIPDLRTMKNTAIDRPSPDLLDTIYRCQERQDWYRRNARLLHDPQLPMVGSATIQDEPEEVAAKMRVALGFEVEARRSIPTWTEALRRFIERADALGVLVMVSGIVGSNTRRKLDPEEFRGFALCDPLAPLVFVNGADTRAAQIFTLAHELAHLWLGESALSDVGPGRVPTQEIERFCNRVAAELLVPAADLRESYRADAPLEEEVARQARVFKVSTLVILRRLHDIGVMAREEMWVAYKAELARLKSIVVGKGGSFYSTTGARVGKRFARALVVSTLEGQTLYREAFHLLGIKKTSTLHELGHRLGIT